MDYISVLRTDYRGSSNFFAQNSFKTTILPHLVKCTLADLVISFGSAAAALPFVATASIGPMIGLAGMAVISSLFLRTVAVGCSSQALYCERDKDLAFGEKLMRFTAKFCQYAAPFAIAFSSYSSLSTLIHETGHVLAAKSLYVLTSGPTVQITQTMVSLNGLTSITWSGLTSIGNALGALNSSRILNAAGAAMVVFTSVFQLGIANSLKSKFETAAWYLRALAISGIVTTVLYASQVLWKSPLPASHDFQSLSNQGIGPAVAIATIIAIPLLFQGGLYLYERIRDAHAARNKPAELKLTPANSLAG